MGTLTDAGLIVDGKVSDESFMAYVSDVIKMLQSGNGIFPQGFICNKEVKPNPAAKDLDLNNKKLFPDFHRIWRPRFEKMVLSLDTPGDFQLAKNGLIPFIDPTALATLLGAKPANLTIPEILLQMITGNPPLISLAPPVPYFALNLDPSAFSPADVPGMLLKILDAIKPIPPLPPIPSLPNPILLKFGYTEQFNFDLALALAPITTHLKLMMPALLLKEMPGLFGKLAQGDIMGGLIKFMCDQISADQPKSMSTSDIEIAAQQILQQYQVKYQTVSFVGQLIGSGAITTAFAKNPMEKLGLDFPQKPSSNEGADRLVGETSLSNSLREDIGLVITGVLGVYQDGKFAEVPAEAAKGARNAPPPAPVNITQNQLKTATEQAHEAEWTEPTTTFADADQQKSVDPNFDGSPKATPKEIVAAAKKPDDQQSPAVQALTTAQLAEETRKAGNVTSCGQFVGDIFQMYFKKHLITSAVATTYKSSKETFAGPGYPRFTMSAGGLSSYMSVALTIEQGEPNKKGQVWCNVDPGTLSPDEVDAALLRVPSKCDIILEYTFLPGKREFNTIAAAEANLRKENTVNGVFNQDKYNAARTLKNNVWEWKAAIAAEESAAKPGATAKKKRPFDGVVIQHVCFFWQQIELDGVEYWITADGGQGTLEVQTIKWSKKKITRDPGYGILIERWDSSQRKWLSADSGQKLRHIGGWVNIDLIPELTDSKNRLTVTEVRANNLKNAPKLPPKKAK